MFGNNKKTFVLTKHNKPSKFNDKEEAYRALNATNVNRKKFPHGYIYVLCINEFSLFKVGVSQNPKRRIKDIRAYLPFDLEIIYLSKYDNVYEIEDIFKEALEIFKHKGEWFKIDRHSMMELISINHQYSIDSKQTIEYK